MTPPFLHSAPQPALDLDTRQVQAVLRLDVSPLRLDDWRERFLRAQRSTLLQSYDYAKTMAPRERLRPQWAVIRLNGVEAGLVQMFEGRLFGGLVHVLTLDRGPLWFEGFGGPRHHRLFWQELDRMYPARLGRRRRLIPELAGGASAARVVKDGTIQVVEGSIPYQTVWIDLLKSEEELRAELSGKWRNALNKAEKSDLTVNFDTRGKLAGWLIGVSEADRQRRGYRGPNVKLLTSLIRNFGVGDGFMIGQVCQGLRPIAGALFLRHGSCATYQTGWVGVEGRPVAANNLLLWQSMMALKSRGVTALDLGGINDEDAVGIRHFKLGLGGEHVTLAGQFC
jgi:hypothetical protein